MIEYQPAIYIMKTNTIKTGLPRPNATRAPNDVPVTYCFYRPVISDVYPIYGVGVLAMTSFCTDLL